MTGLSAQIRRDIALGWRGRGQTLVMLGFFLIIITLFPLAAGPDAAMLRPIERLFAPQNQVLAAVAITHYHYP